MARILQIHTRYREPGGEDGVAERERALLEGAGHEVVALRFSNSESGKRAAMQLASYSWNPLTTRRIIEIAKEAAPIVAHVHNTWFATSPSFLPALRRAGVPTVVTIHNYRLMCSNSRLLRNDKVCQLCVGKVPWRGVAYRCYRDSVGASAAAALGIQIHRSAGTWRHGVDKFIALTEFSRGRLIAAGLPAERIGVKANFVDDPGSRSAAPSASGTVAFVGRLSHEKGLETALNAWARSAPPGLELVVAGDGPERERLEALKIPATRFLGRLAREEVEELLLGARATLFPSIWFEAQPLGVLESFAAGTPVLGSALGGLGETIAPLGEPWSVAARSPQAWAEALARLSDDAFVDEAGAKARALFDARHSPKRGISALEECYKEAQCIRNAR